MKKDNSEYENLEERVISFAVNCIKISKELKNDYAGRHLKNQLIRSGSSCALNYAEARYAESKKDFIHKVKIVLKELHETHVCLQMIGKINYHRGIDLFEPAVKECNELISIFVKSANTAQRNLLTKNPKISNTPGSN